MQNYSESELECFTIEEVSQTQFINNTDFDFSQIRTDHPNFEEKQVLTNYYSNIKIFYTNLQTN